MAALKNRYDFLLAVEVINSNPNGDPDMGNMPRQDVETGHGIITDVCLKKKIRDYMTRSMSDKAGYNIYIQSDDFLNSKDSAAYEAVGGGSKKEDPEIGSKLHTFMCDNYFDIRAFGAVLTGFAKMNLNAQVKGPVQVSFGRSVDPIVPQEITITRCAVATENEKKTHDNTMGNKFIVPYGLYIFEGHVSAELAEKTGFSEEDMQALIDALQNMWSEDTSSSRGHVVARKLIVFKHQSKHGNAPYYKLFDKVSITRKDPAAPARSFKDYEFKIDKDIPAEIEVKVYE